jgi:hypothetical protein
MRWKLIVLLVFVGILMGGGAMWLLARRRAEALLSRLPAGYLVHTGGIQAVPSGKMLYEFPRHLGAYVVAHTRDGTVWTLYQFRDDHLAVYHWSQTTRTLRPIRKIDVSRIYEHTGQFFGYRLDVSGAVMALPCPESPGYYFLRLDGGAPATVLRKFRHARPSNQPNRFWVISGNRLCKYDAKRNLIVEKFQIPIDWAQETRHLDVSPNGRFMLRVRFESRGVAGVRRTTYLFEVYDRVDNRSQAFQVSGFGSVEEIVLLDNRFALIVFGFPLMGQWEVKVLDLTTGESAIWEKHHVFRRAYRYIHGSGGAQ